MADKEDKTSSTGDDERRDGTGRRREPRFDWKTGDPIKDRRLQDEDGNPKDDKPDR